MFAYDVAELKTLERRLAQELTLIPFFRALDIKPEQERYFRRDGIDNGASLGQRTIRARGKRWGYYKRRKLPGVTASNPYMVWTGNTMDHTHAKRGVVKIRSRVMSISHNLERKVTNYWDMKSLDVYVETLLDKWIQRALDGKRNIKRATMRAAA